LGIGGVTVERRTRPDGGGRRKRAGVPEPHPQTSGLLSPSLIQPV
jgi:hypothetical protein